MQIKNWKVLFLLPLLAASCSHDPASESLPAKRLTVTIGADPRIEIESQTGGNPQTGVKSRTALDQDGVTVTWATGDIVALWAIKAGGEAQFAAKSFALWHYNADFNAAKFTADIDPMPEDTYNYYAVSPRPVVVNGMQASYAIPSEQTGLFDPSCDVMVAAPVQGGALREGDNSDIVNFQFTHKVHVLKIRIPENKMGMPVSKLEMVFPTPVTGTLTVNATDPAAAPILTAGSNTLSLNFDQPIDAGATVFAVIAPVELTPDQLITIKAYSGKKESYPTTMRGKHFQQAHTTPIALTIPEQHHVTYISFTTSGDGIASIGEKVQNVILTNSDESVKYMLPFNDEGQYKLTFEGVFDDKFSNQPFAVVFDTQNTAVPIHFTMPQMHIDENNELGGFVVPSLFGEDFHNVKAFSNHDNIGITTSNADAGNPNAIDLNNADYGPLPGWTGARIGGKESTCIRTSCRFEGGGFGAASAYTQYPGRVDSAPLKYIKAGKNVRVKISFDYVGGQNAWQMNDKGGGTLGNPIFAYGYTTNQGALKGDTNIDNVIQSDIAVSIDKSWDSPLSDFKHMETHIDGCTNNYRLSWKVTINRKGGTGGWNIYGANGDHWLYLDNVKATIAQ